MNQSVAVQFAHLQSLTTMQRPLFMSQQRHPSFAVQNMVLVSHIDGCVDVARLRSAFEQVVLLSDALRSRFNMKDGQAYVSIDDTARTSDIIELDRAMTGTWAAARSRIPLNPAEVCYDSVIIKHEDDTVTWYLALHHTVTDATASTLVFEATVNAYHDKPITLASYYDWYNAATRAAKDSTRRQRRRDYWQARTKAPGLGELYRRAVTDSATRTIADARRIQVPFGDNVQALIDQRFASDYRSLSKDLAWLTLLTTVTAAYIHRIANKVSFSIGLPLHNRTDAASRNLIGPLVQVYPVDIDIRTDDTWRELYRRVGASVVQSLSHADISETPPTDFEAVVNVIPRPWPDRFGEFSVNTEWLETGAMDATHLLRVQLSYRDQTAATTALALDINQGVADSNQMQRAGGHFMALVLSMAESPDTKVSTCALLGDEELAVLARFESVADFSTPTPNIMQSLSETLMRMDAIVLEPAIASTTTNPALSGKALWQWVNGLARWLKTQGVQPGDRVGIELPRQTGTVAMILATLLVRASFVPIDPLQPERRRRRLAEHARCVLLVTKVPLREALDTRVTDDWGWPIGADEAYLLFTSGSTGTPKGVPITHAGLARYIRFARQSYIQDSRAIVPLFTPLGFDLTITSLFLPLVTGGLSVVVEADGRGALNALTSRSDLNWIKATPSHLEILVRLLAKDQPLRTLVVGGEAFGADLAKRLLVRFPGIQIFNEYGPTEAVVGSMIYKVDSNRHQAITEVPIGRPAPGVHLMVVDANLERVPVGAAGELCISHSGVTAGYIETPADDSTETRAPSPFFQRDGKRFYRTGDLVRLIDPQTLVYLGRIDEQVKVGGIRLEPMEVEHALVEHPAIEQAAVRLWRPGQQGITAHCVTCGLPSNVPSVSFDQNGVCDTCHAYYRVAKTAKDWFKTPADLQKKRDQARKRRSGRYDCMHLLSGGKDSTYALYQLVASGFEVYTLTLDNGFISEEAKDNIRRTVADLEIDHEFVTTEAMSSIFKDSLERYSNVCNGCYKTIYTLATNRAMALGIPMIVTGLSRGQLFETRLIPQQFDDQRFSAEAIDRAVIEARKTYHRMDDAPNRELDTEIFKTDDVFEKIEYLDFYRYVDVELDEMLRFLNAEAPWIRPRDTGRSSNCLINAAGIHVHLAEQGYHNYAIPYAWDVRLGHKTREQAIEELDDELDIDEVNQLLDRVNYRPKQRELLVAWLKPAKKGQQLPSPTALRSFLSFRLPSHAIPAAFASVEALPLSANGKLDTSQLPAPDRVHRAGAHLVVAPKSQTQARIVSLWERLLKIEPIGLDDDFFALGGDSLTAIQMIVALGEELDLSLREDQAFVHTTPRALALVAEQTGSAATSNDSVDMPLTIEMSTGQKAMLFEQAREPDSVKFNVGRIYWVKHKFDATAFASALNKVVGECPTFGESYSTSPRSIEESNRLRVELDLHVRTKSWIREHANEFHRCPFDLEHGPLARVYIAPVQTPTDAPLMAVVLSFHHITMDRESFELLWQQTSQRLHDETAKTDNEVSPANMRPYPIDRLRDEDREYWRTVTGDFKMRLTFDVPREDGQDGFIAIKASVSAEQVRHARTSTTFITALTALAATLRLVGEDDHVAIGCIASTREAEDGTSIGYHLNTLPVELNVAPSVSIQHLRQEVNHHFARSLRHRQYPYAKLIADRRDAGLSGNTHSILFAFDDTGQKAVDASVRSEALWNGCAAADATFFVEINDNQIDLSIEWRGGRLSAKDANSLLGAFDSTLTTLVHQPDSEVSMLSIPALAHMPDEHACDEDEELALLQAPALDECEDVLGAISGYFNTRAKDDCVWCNGQSLSFEELDRRSLILAQHLQSKGVVACDRVVVCLPRSANLIVSMIAVWRVGAVYVPIDPEYPMARVDAMRRIAEARHTIASETSGFDNDETQTIIDEFDFDVVASGETTTNCLGKSNPDSTAYFIFTSGSTGEPRAVAVTHAALNTSTAARVLSYPDEPTRFLMLSSVAFDSSIVGLVWPLVRGGTIVLPTPDEVADVDALSRLMTSTAVTHCLMVPTLYRSLVERVEEHTTTWPVQVIVAGEACPASLIDLHYRRFPTSRLANEYGPTECTVWATVHHCERGDDPVPIGQPIAGTWVAVIDDSDNPVRMGQEGELVIGGDGLSLGYVTDEEATRSRFGSHPSIEDGARFFRTRDRAIIKDGKVYFRGRLDYQLNIGGVRSEPEEIETVIGRDHAVVAVIVCAVDPRRLDQLIAQTDAADLAEAMQQAALDGDPATALDRRLRLKGASHAQLVAHVALGEAPDIASDISESQFIERLRTIAAQGLPRMLRPQRYVFHESLPVTANGKIDRARTSALPIDANSLRLKVFAELDTQDSGENDDLMQRIAAIFKQVLRTSTVSVDDSFFDLGGHSLLAMDLVRQLTDSEGERIGLQVLYNAPTPRAIAAHIAASRRTRDETITFKSIDSNRLATDVSRREYLVPISPGGSGMPIYGVHVLGKNAAYYRPLATRLGTDHPVFGLAMPSSDAAPTSVHEVAAIYADQIEAVTPDTPVVLAGVSLGSAVAFELAHQLVSRGQPVAALVFFDAVGPEAVGRQQTGLTRAGLHLKQLTSNPGRYLKSQAIHQHRRVTRTIENTLLSLSNRSGKERSERLRVRQIIEQNWRSQIEYPYEACPVPIVVLRASENPFVAALNMEGMGWTKVAVAGLSVVEIPGTHMSILREPNVAHVAEQFRHVTTTVRKNHKIDADTVERTLRKALHDGSLGTWISRYQKHPDRLDKDATALVTSAEAVTSELARRSETAAGNVVASFEADGIRAHALPVASRMAFCLARVAVGEADMARACQHVTDHLGFRQLDGTLRFVATDNDSTRLELISHDGQNGTASTSKENASVARADAVPMQTSGEYLGTPPSLIAPILEFAAVGPDDFLFDIGCGDGRVLIEAVRVCGCRARGFEIDKELAEVARKKVQMAGLQDRIEIITADALLQDLEPATVLFAFLPASYLADSLWQLQRRASHDARIVGHEQVRARWPIEPARSRLIMNDGLTVAHQWQAPFDLSKTP